MSRDIAWDLTDLEGHAKGYQTTIGRLKLKLGKAKSLHDQIHQLVQKPGILSFLNVFTELNIFEVRRYDGD